MVVDSLYLVRYVLRSALMLVPVKFALLVFFEEFNGINLDGLDRLDG